MNGAEAAAIITLASVIAMLVGTNVACALAWRGAVNDFVHADEDRITAILTQHAAEHDRDEALAAQTKAEAERDQAVAAAEMNQGAARAADAKEILDVTNAAKPGSGVDPVALLDRVRGVSAVPGDPGHPAGDDHGHAAPGGPVQPAAHASK